MQADAAIRPRCCCAPFWIIAGRLALVPNRLFTATSDSTEAGIVVVDGDRIASIVGSLDRADVQVLRFPGTTLMPGLIDAHTHVSILPSRGDELSQMRVDEARALLLQVAPSDPSDRAAQERLKQLESRR